MSKPLIYVAHPIFDEPEANVLRAAKFLRAFLDAGHVAIAPYLVSVAMGWDDDDDPEQRERALQRCESIAARCDFVALCGRRITPGMIREAKACGQDFELIGEIPFIAASKTTTYLESIEYRKKNR